MRTPAVALAGLLLVCLLPARADEIQDNAISDDVSAIVAPSAPLPQASAVLILSRPTVPVTEQADVELDHVAPADKPKRNLLSAMRPFGNSFYVSGGTYNGGRNVGLGTSLQRGVQLGDVEFPQTDYGTPDERIGYQEVVPFIGGGISRRFETNGQWDMKLLAGAAFYGNRDMRGNSAGALAPDRTEQAYDVQPMLQLGVSYKF